MLPDQIADLEKFKAEARASLKDESIQLTSEEIENEPLLRNNPDR